MLTILPSESAASGESRDLGFGARGKAAANYEKQRLLPGVARQCPVSPSRVVASKYCSKGAANRQQWKTPEAESLATLKPETLMEYCRFANPSFGVVNQAIAKAEVYHVQGRRLQGSEADCVCKIAALTYT